jgi:hypothetical protein
MTYFTVFCLSSSSLFYEILLTRYFSISHGNHLSFLVIGVAMLGCAASGTLFSLIGGGWLRGARAAFPAVSLLASASILGSFLLVRLLPLDYLRFPVERIQFLYFLSAAILLSLPFFFSGLGSCLAYLLVPEHSGRVAAVSMAGSGLGAILPALALPLVGEGGSIAAAALLPLLPPVVFAFAAAVSRPTSSSLALCACVAIFAAFISLFALRVRESLLTPAPSPYMALPQLLMTPGSRATDHSTSVWGSFTSVESPALRFAPGMSLGYSAEIPPQSGIARDGDDLTVLSDLSMEKDAQFARATHSYAGYILTGRPRSVLVIQRSGGLGVACASASGASRIVVVVEQPDVAGRMIKHYTQPDIEVRADNPRSFLARAGEPFDAIQLEDWGSSLPGMASLEEDTLLTVDALRACWKRLSGRGVLIISRRIILPPSDGLRLFAASLLALKAEGIGEPSEHLAVIRNWDTYTILVSRGSVRGAPLESLRRFAAAMSFDLDWYPGIVREDTNRFNRLPGALFFEAFSSLARDPDSLKRYFLDVAPQGDERSFPNRFIRWSRVGEFFRSTGGRTYTLLLSGELVAAASLAEALIVSLPLLVLPFLVRGRGKPGRLRMRILLLFAACGFGFLFAEIAFLDSFTLLFSNPFVTLSIVLGGLLAWSGVGGIIAERLDGKAFAPVIASIVILLLLVAALLPTATRFFLPFGLPGRIAACIAFLSVPSIFLGIPFPLAMRFMVSGARPRSFAWAANGCASTAASAAGAVIAMSLGTSILFAAAAGAYFFMFLSAIAGRRRRLPVA